VLKKKYKRGPHGAAGAPEVIQIVVDGGETKEASENVDENRRNFLKAAVTTSTVLAVVGALAVVRSVGTLGVQTSSSGLTFPKIKVANVSQLKVNTPLTFNYPLTEGTPNILVKTGQTTENGAGPDNDIIAFSDVCQHLGCNPLFVAPGQSPPCNPSYTNQNPVMYCCCHGSIYDILKGADVIGGPAPRPVPRVTLEVDSNGDIYATGMGPPTIFGHGTPGSTDVSADLQGGTVVGTT
jgi:arsenite oxidase small subunit